MINRLGDSYVAGFLYVYLIEGDIAKDMVYGSACAALSTTIPNETMPLFTKDRVE